MPPASATSPQHPDPGLRTRYYAAPYADVWRAVRDIFDELPGLSFTEERPERQEVAGIHSPGLLGGKREVAIRVEESETGEIEVQATAEARGGFLKRGDGSDTLRFILARLDERLNGAR